MSTFNWHALWEVDIPSAVEKPQATVLFSKVLNELLTNYIVAKQEVCVNASAERATLRYKTLTAKKTISLPIILASL